MENNCCDFERVALSRTGAGDTGRRSSADQVDSRFDEGGKVPREEYEPQPETSRFGDGDHDPRPSFSVTADSITQSKSAVDRDEGYLREIASRDKRVADLEGMCKSAVRERELAILLSGKPLVPGAAAQLIKLWRDEFDVFEENGAYKVATREGRAVEQVVTEWLASPEYSHFCLPASRGGTGARDASKPSRAVASENLPRNLGEVIVMKWREESASQPDALLKPIGLRRHR